MEAAEVTVTSKGQITIPAAIRKKLNLEAGSKLRFTFSEEDEEMVTMKPIRRDITTLFNIFDPRASVSIEEMDPETGYDLDDCD
ncbi:MAG: AbrB/MazE/SpoVT family DNA-binding domain-containing protein [Acidobacteriota bacterium]|nr:AbrB/MazE/SpoVT family DNA-binding domain-containing protein [Acidobacteriota bacterium]